MVYQLSSYLLSLYCIYGILKSLLLGLLYFILRKKFPFERSTSLREGKRHIQIVIPLLNEETIFSALTYRLTAVLDHCPNLSILLVTTAREFSMRCDQSVNTITLVDEFLETSVKYQDRLFHYTYPNHNKVVAEQLNFGILESLHKSHSKKPDYFLFYNADSVFNSDSIACFLDFAERYPQCAFQQSSLFLANVPLLLTHNRYVAASLGLYQSAWTLLHEIPRYLHFCGKKRWHRILGQIVPIHCVMHGLMIPSKYFLSGGTFPEERFGGEDLTIGIALKAQGIPIIPVTTLENSDTPPSFKAALPQLSVWYMAVLTYPVCAFRHLASDSVAYSRRIYFYSVIGGIVDSIRWPAKLLLVLGAALCVTEFWLSIHAIVFFLVYCSVQQGIVYLVWYPLPHKLFPKIRNSEKVLLALIFPLASLLRSATALIGATLTVKVIYNKKYVKQKTQR